MTKYFLLLFTLLMGCGESRKEIMMHNAESNVLARATSHPDFTIVIIDSCEYVVYDRNHIAYNAHSSGITHKGNCKNHSLHRDWMRELSEKQNKEVGK